MHGVPSDIPSDLLHSFPRGLSLPKEGASLLHPLHCRTVLLHSHAGPPDAPVSGTYGGLRQSCEYLPGGRLWGRGRQSKRSNLREMGGQLWRKGYGCIDHLLGI